MGMAVLSSRGEVRFRKILSEEESRERNPYSQGKYGPLQVVVGNSTGSEKVLRILEKMNLPFTLVDERNSSEEARKLYFQAHPPSGLEKDCSSFFSLSR